MGTSYVTLEITLISAKDLKKASRIGRMDVYVVGSLSTDDDPKSTNKQKTPVCQDGGTEPTWNHTMRFTVEASNATQTNLELVFALKHETFGPDKDVGEVRIPVRELIVNAAAVEGQKDPQFAAYQVKSQGELNVSYKVFDAPDYQPAAAQTSYAADAADPQKDPKMRMGQMGRTLEAIGLGAVLTEGAANVSELLKGGISLISAAADGEEMDENEDDKE